MGRYFWDSQRYFGGGTFVAILVERGDFTEGEVVLLGDEARARGKDFQVWLL